MQLFENNQYALEYVFSELEATLVDDMDNCERSGDTETADELQKKIEDIREVANTVLALFN